MNNPWKTKWSRGTTPELVSRLIDLTSHIMSVIEDAETGQPLEINPYDFPSYVDADGNVKNATHDGIALDLFTPNSVVTELTSEAHWISEELEHRIRKSKYAGLWDIEIVKI